MANIDYYGHFSDFSGYGKTARDFVLLLDYALLPDSIPFSVDCYSMDAPHLIKEFQGDEWHGRCTGERRNQTKDILIVHKSPWLQDLRFFTDDFLRPYKQKIFFTVFETSLWPASWKPVLEKFDKIVTFSSWQKTAAQDLMGKDWNDKIFVVPHPVEKLPEIENNNEYYTFYSEFSAIIERKGLDVLLKAYFNAFDEKDKVLLRIKYHHRHHSKFLKIMEYAENCFNYKKLPRIETCKAFIADQEMNELMAGCDCYVNSSRGEGFCVPLAKAAMNKKPVIYPIHINDLGYPIGWGNDYCDGHYVISDLSRVITDSFATFKMKINTERMYWVEPDITNLSNALLWHYRKEIKTIDNSKALSYLSKNSICEKLKTLLLKS